MTPPMNGMLGFGGALPSFGGMGKYGQMFGNLAPWEPKGRTALSQHDAVLARVRDFSKEDPSEAPQATRDRDNIEIPAIYTYFGQFLAHDMSFDATSIHSRDGDPHETIDYRTPGLDLDCVYGAGPRMQPNLYGAYALELDAWRTERWSELRAFGFPHGRVFDRDAERNPFEIELLRTEELVYPIAPEGRPDGEDWLVQVRANEGKTVAEFLKLQGVSATELLERAAASNQGQEAVEKLRCALGQVIVTTDFRDVRVPGDAVIFEERSGKRFGFVRLAAGGMLPMRIGDRVEWRPITSDRIERRGGLAIIADRRNDENVLLAQLHLAVMRFHNAALRRVAEEGGHATPDSMFNEARRMTQWHYQWIVLHDYLPKIVKREQIEAIPTRSGRDLGARLGALPPDAYLPVEFTAAAFRFGHSMVRPRYRLNSMTAEQPLLAKNQTDMRGSQHLRPGWSLEWGRFLGPQGAPVGGNSGIQASRRIGLTAIAPFFERNLLIGHMNSLIELDLLRSWQKRLPSGQAVAKSLGYEVMKRMHPGEDDPLLVYILREAHEQEQGLRLGEVGGRLVASVLIDLLASDKTSFLNQNPGWTPSQDGLFTGRTPFGLRDFVAIAGMPMTAGQLRDWVRRGPPELRANREMVPANGGFPESGGPPRGVAAPPLRGPRDPGGKNEREESADS